MGQGTKYELLKWNMSGIWVRCREICIDVPFDCKGYTYHSCYQKLSTKNMLILFANGDTSEDWKNEPCSVAGEETWRTATPCRGSEEF